MRLSHSVVKWGFRKVIPDDKLLEKYKDSFQRYVFNDLERDVKTYVRQVFFGDKV